MSCLNRWGLQVADRWKISCVDSIKKIVNVVLMVGRIALLANHADRSWTDMRGIRGRGVVLERLAVRAVILVVHHSGNFGRTAAIATGAAIRVSECEIETSREPS